MAILDRAPDVGSIRSDAARFTDELARRLPQTEPFDIAKARETAGTAVHDAADRARESFDQAAELVRVLRSDIAHAGDRVQADNPLDEIGGRIRAVASTTAIRALIARLERELPDTDRDRYARAFARGRAQGRSKNLAIGIAAGAAVGIVAALLLEPGHGKERRDRIGRKAGSLTSGVSSRVASTARVAGDRARGIVAERGLVRPEAGTPGSTSADPVTTEVVVPEAVSADAVAGAAIDPGAELSAGSRADAGAGQAAADASTAESPVPTA
jgi:hypothetical protein